MTWPREREWVGGREIESGCVGEREQERVRDKESERMAKMGIH